MSEPFDWAESFPSFKRFAGTLSKESFIEGRLEDDYGWGWDCGLDPISGEIAWLSYGSTEFDINSVQWKTAQQFIYDRMTWPEEKKPVARQPVRASKKDASALTEEASLRVHAAFASGPKIHRNSRVKRIIGVSKVPHAGYAYLSMDPSKSFAFLCDEGDDETPENVDERIAKMRSLNDARPAIVVVEGSKSWIQRFLTNCQQADAFVVVADEETLDELDIEVIDRGWEKGQPPRDLDLALFGSRPRVVAGLKDEPFPTSEEASERSARQRLDMGASRAPAPVERPKTVQRSTASGAPETAMANAYKMGRAEPPDPELIQDESAEEMDDYKIAAAAASALESNEALYEEEPEPQVAKHPEPKFQPGDLVMDTTSQTKGRVAAIRGDGQAEVDFEDTPQGMLDAIPLVELLPVTSE